MNALLIITSVSIGLVFERGHYTKYIVINTGCVNIEVTPDCEVENGMGQLLSIVQILLKAKS